MKTLIASALLAVALGVSAASAHPVFKSPANNSTVQSGYDFVTQRHLDGE